MISNISHRWVKVAFTLVELLVVVTIIIILAALILPILSNSVKSAYVTDARTKMRQFAVAQQLYVSDNENRVTYNLAELQMTGYIPKKLLGSHIDPFELGHANVLVKEMSSEVPNTNKPNRLTDYQLSFLSLGHTYNYQNDYLEKYLFPNRNAGWVIFASHSFGNECVASINGSASEIAGVSCGKYLRLTIEGSILSRTAGQKTCEDKSGAAQTISSPIFVFADGGSEWCKLILEQ